MKITHASPTHSQQISTFQQKMALQTEHLTLSPELVDQAVSHLIANPQYGQYFISIREDQPEQAYSSLLITYENEKSWWVQSVYVVESMRRQGLFTGMFREACGDGRRRGVGKVQLYVEKENGRAIETYKKLGMYITGDQFYGYELVYGKQDVLKMLAEPINDEFVQIVSSQNKQKLKQYKIEDKNREEFNKFTQISGQSSPYNRYLVYHHKKHPTAYCQYFYQFSDWRFGLIIYINNLKIDESSLPGQKQHSLQLQSKILQNLTRYLYQNCPLKVGAIRMIAKPEQIRGRLKVLAPEMHEDVYYVMRIDL